MRPRTADRALRADATTVGGAEPPGDSARGPGPLPLGAPGPFSSERDASSTEVDDSPAAMAFVTSSRQTATRGELDGTYRWGIVKMKRRGMNVVHRPGYWAVAVTP